MLRESESRSPPSTTSASAIGSRRVTSHPRRRGGGTSCPGSACYRRAGNPLLRDVKVSGSESVRGGTRCFLVWQADLHFGGRGVYRGGEQPEPGHGQPPAGDPGAAEVAAAAPSSAGVRPVGGSISARARPPLNFFFPPSSCPSFCELSDQHLSRSLSLDFYSLFSSSACQSHSVEDQPLPGLGFLDPRLRART